MGPSEGLMFLCYNEFYEIEEIGSGSSATIYTAKHRVNGYPISQQDRVVLKHFKNFDQMPEVFITEVSNLRIVINLRFIKLLFNLTVTFH